MSSRLTLCWLILLAALVCCLPGATPACPFCTAVSMTLSEEVAQSAYVVLARPIDAAEPVTEQELNSSSPDASATDGTAAAAPPTIAAADAVFEIVEVLKGEEKLGKKREIKLMYFSQHPPETQFLVFGSGAVDPVWTTPTALSERAVEYVRNIVKLPSDARSRLLYFQDYLEDAETMLAGDAYDEFAKAPYADVKLIKERMNRERLLEWVRNQEVPASRRRLYLTMLGICGTQEDIPALEEMIKSQDRHTRTALDAMIASYLTLKGAEGMPLIEDLFLKPTEPKAEYTDTYAAIMAIRFHLQETDAVPKPRLIEGLRHMLERSELADLVIPDLARWQDWTVMERLVELFKDAKKESTWVRVPVVNYLRACPLPEAKVYIDELSKIDPESVKRASQFFPVATPKKTETAAQGTNDKSSDANDTPPAAAGNSAKADGSAAGGDSASADAVPPSGTVQETTPTDSAADGKLAEGAGPNEGTVPGEGKSASANAAGESGSASPDQSGKAAVSSDTMSSDTVSSDTVSGDTVSKTTAEKTATSVAPPSKAGTSKTETSKTETSKTETGKTGASSGSGGGSMVIAIAVGVMGALFLLLWVILRGSRGSATT